MMRPILHFSSIQAQDIRQPVVSFCEKDSELCILICLEKALSDFYSIKKCRHYKVKLSVLFSKVSRLTKCIKCCFIKANAFCKSWVTLLLFDIFPLKLTEQSNGHSQHEHTVKTDQDCTDVDVDFLRVPFDRFSKKLDNVLPFHAGAREALGPLSQASLETRLFTV